MGGGAQSNDRPQIDPRNTHIAGLILKELFVPQADNGLKTCHIFSDTKIEDIKRINQIEDSRFGHFGPMPFK